MSTGLDAAGAREANHTDDAVKSDERPGWRKELWPTPADEALAKRAWVDLVNRATDQAMDFVHDDLLPISVAMDALLVAAAKLIVLDARLSGKPVRKIAARWNLVVSMEERALARRFAVPGAKEGT